MDVMELCMKKITKPNFAYQPFQDFVESGGFGTGPELIIGKSTKVVICLSGWKREENILYVLEFIHNNKHFGAINFYEPKCYFINKYPVYPTIFMDKIINLAKDHPALMDFVLWNLL
jgi:hypothetical protein